MGRKASGPQAVAARSVTSRLSPWYRVGKDGGVGGEIPDSPKFCSAKERGNPDPETLGGWGWVPEPRPGRAKSQDPRGSEPGQPVGRPGQGEAGT